METVADYGNPDDWELQLNEDFVYKRSKRPRVDLTASSSAAPPALVGKNLRKRTKRNLLKLKENFLEEIHQWGILSNTLRDLHNSPQLQPVEREESCPTTEGQLKTNSISRRIVDDILYQVEAQEAIIQKVSNICDVAEALCIAQEDRLKQQFTDLPILELSPQELMAALCERYTCFRNM